MPLVSIGENYWPKVKRYINKLMTSSTHSQYQKNLLLIFTRNPELGKCKTRLAAKVGEQTALEIYTFLLEHTHCVTREVKATMEVLYSEEIWENDIWENSHYH